MKWYYYFPIYVAVLRIKRINFSCILICICMKWYQARSEYISCVQYSFWCRRWQSGYRGCDSVEKSSRGITRIVNDIINPLACVHNIIIIYITIIIISLCMSGRERKISVFPTLKLEGKKTPKFRVVINTWRAPPPTTAECAYFKRPREIRVKQKKKIDTKTREKCAPLKDVSQVMCADKEF